MKQRKEKLLIINRSFWPVYPVIGEALLRFAEQQAYEQEVGVVLQDHADIQQQLIQHDRGQGVKFFPCKAWSISGSGIFRRIIDAVFFMCWVLMVLLWQRPTKVYVSTDPPVIVPFIVMLYSKLFGASYVYHLQDIHPEAANVVIPVNPLIYRFFRWLDSVTMRQANLLITITEEMADEIKNRSNTQAPVQILANPSVAFEDITVTDKRAGFTFCGNAGRLQRIPLLIDAISTYCEQGGRLPFVFAGGGVYASALKELAAKYPDVTYKGLISSTEAAQLNADYQWALLPIEDEVTRYAFPSKSSSYVYSGAFIAAICGGQTSVSLWVKKHKLGEVVAANVANLIEFFFAVEKNQIDMSSFDTDRSQLKDSLSFEVFLAKLTELIIRK